MRGERQNSKFSSIPSELSKSFPNIVQVLLVRFGCKVSPHLPITWEICWEEFQSDPVTCFEVTAKLVGAKGKRLNSVMTRSHVGSSMLIGCSYAFIPAAGL